MKEYTGQVIIDNRKYRILNGIGRLKRKYGDTYSKLPGSFKHEDIKKSWSKVKAVPERIWLMSESKDKDMHNLCEILCQESSIPYVRAKVRHYDYHIGKMAYEEGDIIIFPPDGY